MTVYVVVKENGSFVCGPFRKMEQAEKAQQNYNGVWCWGNCYIKQKEIETEKGAC